MLTACCSDIEFDLENDKDNCLYGLFNEEEYSPADVHRVTQIFDKPHFFDDDEKPGANDIIQGALGDTWFLSALATVSTVGELIKTLCVAVRPSTSRVVSEIDLTASPARRKGRRLRVHLLQGQRLEDRHYR